MHGVDRAAVGVDGLSGGVSQGGGLGLGVRPGDPVPQGSRDRRAHPLHKGRGIDEVRGHVRHRTLTQVSTDQPSPVNPDIDRRIPRWIARAIVLFWLGYIVVQLFEYSFDRLQSLLLLLLASLFLGFAIEPAVNKLSERGWKRGRATGTIMLGVVTLTLGFIGAVGTFVGTQLADLLRNSEEYVNDAVDFINDTFNTKIDPAEVNESIADPDGPVQRFIANQQDRALGLSVQALGVLFASLTVLLFTYYIVADGPRLRRAICSRLEPDRQRRVLETWELAVTKTGGFLYSRALLALLSTFFHWIAFQAIGTPAPIVMALWVGLISQFLPVVGTYLAGVLPVLLTLLESPVKALVALGFIAVYQQVENYLFAPRITARTLELHPALAFAAAIAGAALIGPIGALIALPGAAMAQALISAAGPRHDVVDDPLTQARESVRERRRRERESGL